jgi:hypothetical protein
MAKRRTGGRGATRNVFAVLWIALAGLSGFYLFTLFTDPTALGGPALQMSAAPADSTPAAPAPAAPAAPAPAQTASLDTAEVSSLKGTIQSLSQQLAQLDSRLQPIERFIGPVAALPPSATVSTSPPKPQEPAPAAAAAPEPETEPEAEVVEEVVEETVVETPPPPPAPPPVAAAPEPEPEPEPEPVAESAPEPETPAPVAVADEPEPEVAVAEEDVEIAAIDPVTLPPAANDGSTRYGIEIGTVGKRDELRPLWREYLTKHAALVAGLQPRRVLAPDKKWRLIAGPFSNAQDAEGACSLFQKADRPCAATVYAGDAL